VQEELMSSMRLAPLLALSTSLVACATQGEEEEPVTLAEQNATTSAVEQTVSAMSPITSVNAQSIASAYQMAYSLRNAADGGSCATVETNGLTFVQVTFACTQQLLPITGTLRLEITSTTTVEATADLKVANTDVDGHAKLTVPANAMAPRTLEANLVIAGPQRELSADADASWVVNGNCLTLNATGMTSVGAASRSWQITNKTICHE
jgi:hypothetical protein